MQREARRSLRGDGDLGKDAPVFRNVPEAGIAATIILFVFDLIFDGQRGARIKAIATVAAPSTLVVTELQFFIASPLVELEIQILQRLIPTKQGSRTPWQAGEQKPGQSPDASAHGSMDAKPGVARAFSSESQPALVCYPPTCCQYNVADENARQLAASRLPKSCHATYCSLDLAPEAMLGRFAAAPAPAREQPKLVAARPL
ncbi:hypothetical protein ABIB80_006687 [Bradyrhizobium sp. i1.15.2]|uniref:hypothetical protein n=1 Tax=Bradyrhizobium sp. i1.15.2 TaxID=3156362 RepID=UPI00339840F2